MLASKNPAVVRPAPRRHARLRLVCLSYSGGGTAPFRRWSRSLPDDVELVLICYPGREGRFNTPAADSFPALLDDVIDAVRPLAADPYVLFGHSFGAGVAFEGAAALTRLGVPPVSLVVSACEAPVDWHVRAGRSPSLRDSDERLLAWMRDVGQMPEAVLAEPELCEMAVNLLRADMTVSRSYRYLPGTKVDAPIRVLHGSDDPTVTAGAAARWRLVAGGSCVLTELPGGHFYTDVIWAGLPELILA